MARRSSISSSKCVGVAFCFLAGLAAMLWVVDAALGRRMERLGWKKWLGPQVYEARLHARSAGPDVRSIYLGDSVARQLFRPGQEPGPSVRYLTSVGGVAMAGQYYLLRDALQTCPQATEVYLLLVPGSLSNNLEPPLANDYFCEFFREPQQIAEVFAAKRDASLLTAHVGRLLLPHLMAENSRLWASADVSPTAATATSLFPSQGIGHEEPLLNWVSRRLGRPAFIPPVPGEMTLCPVSRFFLPKIRILCDAHGARLHVLPCPVSDEYRFNEASHLYDQPILHLPRAQFRDGMHLKPAYVEETRRLLAIKYQL